MSAESIVLNYIHILAWPVVIVLALLLFRFDPQGDGQTLPNPIAWRRIDDVRR
jgi:hypothetical protein